MTQGNKKELEKTDRQYTAEELLISVQIKETGQKALIELEQLKEYLSDGETE